MICHAFYQYLPRATCIKHQWPLPSFGYGVQARDRIHPLAPTADKRATVARGVPQNSRRKWRLAHNHKRATSFTQTHARSYAMDCATVEFSHARRSQYECM